MSSLQKSRRGLGVWMLTALVAGNMIGSGVFLLPASLASFGSIGILGWVFTAIGAIFLALVFAKLSTIVPKAGGPYAYTREGFGDFVGFQVAYNYWIALWVGNAAIVVAFVGYLGVFFPTLVNNPALSCAISIITIWLITIVNIIGVRQAGVLQLVTTILKLLPLFLIATFGLFFIKWENLSAFNVSGNSNLFALTGAASLTLWAFIGLESATVPADDVENPQRDIPRATIYGTLVTAVVYILSTTAVMGMIPVSELAHSTSPYADAAKHMFPHWGYTNAAGNWVSWGQLLIAAGAVISCFGALNGWTLLQGQVPMAAAKDNLFPAAFGKTSKQGTPVFGLVVSSLLITVLLLLTLNASLVKQFTFIILLATLASLIPYLFTTMSELILFVNNRELFNKKKLIKSSLIAIIAAAYSFWAITGAGQDVVYYGCLLWLTSIPVYVWMQWRATVPNNKE